VALGNDRVAVPVVVHVAEPGTVLARGVAHVLDDVLGERPGLDDHPAFASRVEIDQFHHGGLRIDAGYQGSHARREARTPADGIVVADPGLLQASVVDDLRAAPGELHQGFGDHGI
jgi:hypothetical protein